MSKVKLLSVVSISLLLINVLLMWQLFGNNTRNRKPNGPKQQIIGQLQFDANQIKQYEALIIEHKSSLDASNQTLLTLRKQLYQSLQSNAIITNTDSLNNEIAKATVQMEQVNMKHFANIKTICKPEQMPLYDEFCNKIAELFINRKGKRNGDK